MSGAYPKKYATASAVTEMKRKITLRFHLTPENGHPEDVK